MCEDNRRGQHAESHNRQPAPDTDLALGEEGHDGQHQGNQAAEEKREVDRPFVKPVIPRPEKDQVNPQ
jgi:hypothetical protein